MAQQGTKLAWVVLDWRRQTCTTERTTGQHGGLKSTLLRKTWEFQNFKRTCLMPELFRKFVNEPACALTKCLFILCLHAASPGLFSAHRWARQLPHLLGIQLPICWRGELWTRSVTGTPQLASYLCTTWNSSKKMFLSHEQPHTSWHVRAQFWCRQPSCLMSQGAVIGILRQAEE